MWRSRRKAISSARNSSERVPGVGASVWGARDFNWFTQSRVGPYCPQQATDQQKFSRLEEQKMAFRRVTGDLGG
jgi:hypothetical protein